MRKITLNESEMINFVSMLIERVNLEGYTDEDFIEVFVTNADATNSATIDFMNVVAVAII